MNLILRNIFAVLVGLTIGAFINMCIIMVSSSIIPPPNGIDVTTEAGLKAALPLFEPKHFVFPFLAHAVGTFTGALVTAFIAGSRKMRLAMVIGVVFLIGGISMVIQLPSPIWFTIIDLVGAYIPFAYLAGKIMTRNQKLSTQL